MQHLIFWSVNNFKAYQNFLSKNTELFTVCKNQIKIWRETLYERLRIRNIYYNLIVNLSVNFSDSFQRIDKLCDKLPIASKVNCAGREAKLPRDL